MNLQYKEIKNLAVEIDLPASKSISNRALIIQALANEDIQLSNLSAAMDTSILSQALLNKSYKKDIGMAGTAARFLSAYLSTQKTTSILTGDDRMQKRPMRILLDALTELGAEIRYLNNKGYLPIEINGTHTKGGTVNVDSSVSSQFITALMLIAPRLAGGLNIKFAGSISSAPYIQMTQSIMEHFEVVVVRTAKEIRIEEQTYKANKIHIKSDWSAASYFYSALALMDEGSMLLKNLSFHSWQGDEIAAEIYYRLGVVSSKVGDDVLLEKTEHVIDYLNYDFIDCPDLAQSVICTCIGLGIEGEFKGLHTLRGKETDRIQALQNESLKLNWLLEETAPGTFRLYRQTPRQKIDLNIETYNDHRMAMAFAPLCIVYDQLVINHPEVVNKSFPNFWKQLQKIGIE